MDFINSFEPDYDPLPDRKYWCAKINFLMDNFLGFMQNLNEKKEILTKTYPDKAIKVEKRLTCKKILNPGQYTLQRKVGYVMAKSVHPLPLYKRQLSGSPPAVPTPKK